MNYLQSFLEEKRRAEEPKRPTDKTDKSPAEAPKGGIVSFVSASEVPKDAKFQTEHLSGSQTVTPDSRNPLVKPEIRVKIEAIEARARALGWPAELLWNTWFWDRPRGLAAVLEECDEITDVTSDSIGILKSRHDLLRFRRHTA
jgi:hypothetical protein